jgi:hypothetical protein
MPELDNYAPDPDKRRLKISIGYHDSGAIFHQVRYFDKKLTNNDVLEQMWCEWNRGSQRESQRFLNAQVRSMMCDDTVSIQEGGVTGPTKHYICEMTGWGELDEKDPRTISIDKDVNKIQL